MNVSRGSSCAPTNRHTEFRFGFHRDNLSGGAEELHPCCGGEPQPAAADDVCPWDVQADGDKKRSLPASIAEERERRLSSTSSSRKNSGGNATPYDSASADESQSDSVANRLRRSCGLGASGSVADRRRGSSATCTPQQTVDRPSVSSAEDFDTGPSPESRSPEKQPPTSPAATQREQPSASSPPLDAKCNRKKLLKTLSLARKQSITPVINVSSVDRDNAAGGCGSRSASQTESVEETATTAVATATGEGDHPPKTVMSTTTEGVAAAAATTTVSDTTDGNDVCPWEDE